MSDRTRLERDYRRLPGCYPREFRRESEDEILGVLLATWAMTHPASARMRGGRRPS
ncbi:MAG: hypothetical protein ACLPN6_18765 [Streptosporangiaceae bacterium]|jgi:hypothetical protein